MEEYFEGMGEGTSNIMPQGLPRRSSLPYRSFRDEKSDNDLTVINAVLHLCQKGGCTTSAGEIVSLSKLAAIFSEVLSKISCSEGSKSPLDEETPLSELFQNFITKLVQLEEARSFDYSDIDELKRDIGSFKFLSREIVEERKFGHSPETSTVIETDLDNNSQREQPGKEPRPTEAGPVGENYDEIIHQNKWLAEQNSNILLQLTEAEEANSVLQKENESLKENIQLLDCSYRKIQRELVKERDMKLDEEKRCNSLEMKLASTTDKLRTVKEHLRSTHKKVSELESKCEDLVRKANGISLENERLMASLTKAEEEKEDLQRMLEEKHESSRSSFLIPCAASVGSVSPQIPRNSQWSRNCSDESDIGILETITERSNSSTASENDCHLSGANSFFHDQSVFSSGKEDMPTRAHNPFDILEVTKMDETFSDFNLLLHSEEVCSTPRRYNLLTLHDEIMENDRGVVDTCSVNKSDISSLHSTTYLQNDTCSVHSGCDMGEMSNNEESYETIVEKSSQFLDDNVKDRPETEVGAKRNLYSEQITPFTAIFHRLPSIKCPEWMAKVAQNFPFRVDFPRKVLGLRVSLHLSLLVFAVQFIFTCYIAAFDGSAVKASVKSVAKSMFDCYADSVYWVDAANRRIEAPH